VLIQNSDFTNLNPFITCDIIVKKKNVRLIVIFTYLSESRISKTDVQLSEHCIKGSYKIGIYVIPLIINICIFVVESSSSSTTHCACNTFMELNKQCVILLYSDLYTYVLTITDVLLCSTYYSVGKNPLIER